MVELAESLKTAAAHWNKVTGEIAVPVSIKWWQSRTIIRHINTRTCGESLDSPGAGLRQWYRCAASDLPAERGLSVGAGAGRKEMGFIKDGLCRRFDLFEISEARIAEGRRIAKAAGLDDRVIFHHGDAFATCRDQYDLVHWDSSLHHMLDVPQAVLWSFERLKPGGWFVVNEYIGATRWQHSQRSLDVASRVRSILPKAMLENGRVPGTFVPTELKRVSAMGLAASDPTEAADSARIVPACSLVFPSGEWRMLGGAVYGWGLGDILWNFERFGAEALLEACLLIDDLASDLGENYYGAFIARRPL